MAARGSGRRDPRIGSIWPRTSEFFTNILQLEISHVSQESIGFWIELQLVGDYVPHEATLGKDTVRGYHGASMYSLPQIAITGMLPSRHMFPGEGYPQGVGVSYMLAEGSSACDTFMVYSPVQNSGWMYAPLVQLIVTTRDPEGRTLGSRESSEPKITYPGLHKVNSVFLHMVHIQQAQHMTQSDWMPAEPGYTSPAGFDPVADLGNALQRARDCRRTL